MTTRPHRAANRLSRLCLIALALAAPAATASAADAATLVVDRDQAQCPHARYASIQSAVDAAQPGDTVKVCADLYAEQVTIDKPLKLRGHTPDDPDTEMGAAASGDCFAAGAAAADPNQRAIVDPAGDGFTVALRLAADDIRIRGFVVQGASVGIDASDRSSGYRIHHNLIEHNTLFGIDFGSDGTRTSRVDHNCLRANGWGVASELDDDSLWVFRFGGGGERGEWNARDLINARIDHNATTGHTGFADGGALQISGPGRRVRVTIDHNLSRQDGLAIALQNSTDSAIVDNDVNDTGGNSIVIGGGNTRLLIASNFVRNAGRNGIFFVETLLDRFPIPNRVVIVTQNHVTGSTGVGAVPASGIGAAPNNLADSLISENTLTHNFANGIILSGGTGNVVRDNQTHNNRVSGIQILSGSTANVIRDNQANDNGIAGISALLTPLLGGATGNRIEHNSMHGNGWRTDTTLPRADARDLNPLLNGMLQNAWTGNDCDTDIPVGMICGVG